MRMLLAAIAVLAAAGSLEAQFTVTSVAVTDAPRRLAAADLDGDGSTDLLVVERGAGDTARLEALLNQGGTFVLGWSQVESVAYPDWETWDVDLGDTDDDGDADIVYCVPPGSPRQRLNDGQGQFPVLTGVPTYSVQFEHTLGDTDADGCLDVVYYEPDFFFDSYFGTLAGQCNGTFIFGSDWIMLTADLEGRRRIALGDVTGDGRTDATFTSLVSGLRLFRGQSPAPGRSKPGWAFPKLVDPTPCADAVIADLDGDGRPDIAATVPSLDAIEVFRTNGHGTPGHPRHFAAGVSPSGLVAADLDLDGVVDLAVIGAAPAVQLLRGRGDGAFDPPVAFHVGGVPWDIAVADLDGDLDPDLAVTLGSKLSLTLLLNETR
jgi:hypothetical protein